MKVALKVAAMLLFVLTGTIQAADNDANSPAPAAEKTVKAADVNGVAVTVNGVAITEQEVSERVKPQVDKIMAQMGPQAGEQYTKYIKTQALDGMIMERLLDEQIKKANITVNASDVNDKINQIISQQGMSMDMFKSMLQAQGKDIGQVREQISKGIAYEKLMDGQVGKTDFNDADALAYYNENKSNYTKPDQVQASHILIKVEPTASEEEKAKAKEKTESLLKQVKDGGDFAELAKVNSDCPSKSRGGDLGFFEKDKMVKPFADAAFAMKVGEVSDIVETQFGYHIIKVTDRKDAGTTSFEEAKPDIIKLLEQRKKAGLYKGYMDKLRAEAKIEYPVGKEPTGDSPMGRARKVEAPPTAE